MMNREHRRDLFGTVVLCAVLLVTVNACAARTYYEAPPMTPQVLEPADAAVLSNGVPIRFVWRASDTAEHYDFHIFDRTSSDIQRYYRAALRPETICAGGQCSLTLSVDMPADAGHAWRVRAHNSAGNSAWSRRLFQIK